MLAAVYTRFFPAPTWLVWGYVAGAIAFAVGLIVLLVIIARRSRWDR